MKVHYDEGVTIRIGPKPCIAGREVRGEASAGDRIGQPLSPDMNILGADAVKIAEGNMDRRVSVSAWTTRRGRTWHVQDASCVETGRSHVRPMAHLPARSASGRRGAVADDARAWEVELRHSSCEADEQGGAIRRGAGGAKGGDQGECGPAKHGPDTATGNRVTGAGAHTASSKAKEEGTVHRAAPPCQRRSAPSGVLRDQEGRRAGCRWPDSAGTTRQTLSASSGICTHGSNGERTGRCRHGASTSQSRTAGSVPLAVAKPRSGTKTRSKVKRAKPIVHHNTRAKSKQDAVVALLKRRRAPPSRPSSRRPAGSPIRCAAFWQAWCARSSG